jgi:hypothetical protein
MSGRHQTSTVHTQGSTPPAQPFKSFFDRLEHGARRRTEGAGNLMPAASGDEKAVQGPGVSRPGPVGPDNLRTMTLYEVVLRRLDRDDEIRFTDHQPKVGSTVSIDGRPWQVQQMDSSSHWLARIRFICISTDNEQHS